MRWIVWAAWLGLAVGCRTPPEVQAQISCGILCECLLPAGPDRDECNMECPMDPDILGAPEDCHECIQAHKTSCSTLIVDCDAECDQPTPPPQVDGGIIPPADATTPVD
jgi:hypothetical protein